MTARKYRRLGRPPGRTGKGGTRPRSAKGGGRAGSRSGCAPAMILAAGLALLAAGSLGWLRWNAAFTAPALLAALFALFGVGQMVGPRSRRRTP